MNNSLLCTLDELVLNNFILFLKTKDIAQESEFKKFELADMYIHVLDCKIHNNQFNEYIDELLSERLGLKCFTRNILYLSKYIKYDKAIQN